MAEDRNLPCMVTGETDVDGAVLPVACDLWQGHERSHYDETVIVFWGREHGGREYVTESDKPEPWCCDKCRAEGWECPAICARPCCATRDTTPVPGGSDD